MSLSPKRHSPARHPSTRPLTNAAPRTPAARPAPGAPKAAAGWTPRPRAARSLAPSETPTRQALPQEPALQPASVAPALSTETPARRALAQAVDAYTARIQGILHHDARSLAAGQVPTRAGDPLSAEQRDQLQAASMDFLTSVPVGALAPRAVEQLTRQLQAAGVDTTDLATRRLGEFGDTGRAFAGQVLESVASGEGSADAYALAGTLAAAAGYTAWTQGSQGLAALGLKPELRRGLFDDQLQVKLAADWQAGLKDFKVLASAAGQRDLGRAGKVSASLSGNSATGLEAGSLDWSVERPNWNFAAGAALGPAGLESSTASGRVSGRLGKLEGQAKLDARGKVDAASLDYAVDVGQVNVQARAALAGGGPTTGQVVVGRKTDASAQTLTVTSKGGRVDGAVARFTAGPSADAGFEATVDHRVAESATTIALAGHVKAGQGALSASALTDASAGLQRGSLEYSAANAQWNLSASASVNADGFDQARVAAGYTWDAGTLNGSVAADAAGAQSAEVRGTYSPSPNFKLSGGVRRDFRANQTTSEVEASWSDGKDASLDVSGKTDSQGQSGFGVRLNVKF